MLHFFKEKSIKNNLKTLCKVGNPKALGLLVSLGMALNGTLANAAASDASNSLENATPAQTAGEPLHAAVLPTLQNMQQHWLVPTSKQFAERSNVLGNVFDKYCINQASLQDVQLVWTQVLMHYESLRTVAMGPFLERSVARNFDAPTDEQYLDLVIKNNSYELQKIGSTVKGLPAIEHLLWKEKVQPHTPSCKYGKLISDELAQEARIINEEFIKIAKNNHDSTEVKQNFDEYFNQWVLGVEYLRFTHIEQPIKTKVPFYRTLSNQTQKAWQTQWQTLKRLAASGTPNTPPQLITLQAHLHARGFDALATELAKRIQTLDTKFAPMLTKTTLSNHDLKKLLEISQQMQQLKTFFETKVMTALNIPRTFSDADGD